MARSGPVLLAVAAATVVACTYTFEVPDGSQITCSDGGEPCPDGWHCEVDQGRCAKNGSVVEVPEVRVQPTTAIATAEKGASSAASLAVVLGATPTAPVRVPVISTRPAEARVLPQELIFDDSNWDQAQTVTVQGVPDDVVDGPQPYEVVVGPPASNDSRYSSLAEIRIPATNADSDVPTIRASPPSITTSESDTPATPQSIQVRLSAQPSAVVIVPVSSSDAGEATVSPAALAFDGGTWDTPQTVLVVGVDDPFPIADGRAPYQINLGPAVSTDPHFQGATGSVDGHNTDNDSPGVRIYGATGLNTYEPNYAAYAYVSLFTQPTADVSITFTSLTTDQVTVDPASRVLTFDAGNWDQDQYVIIQPVDDPYDEIPADVDWTVQSSNTVSPDPNYSNLVVDDIIGQNHDEEVSGLKFDDSFYGSYSTMEAIDSPKQIRVTLSSKPHGAVTVRPASANSSKVVVSPTQFTLDENTWNVGTVMTVTALDNNIREYDPTVDITFSVTAAFPLLDPGYQNPVIDPLQVTIQDDERIIFTTTAGHTGNMQDPGGGSYFILDSLCYTDPVQGQQLFYTSAAMLSVDNPLFTRIASVTANQGDQQANWVLAKGRNYISETRNGPVIGRANDKNLLDFPLAHALTAAGDAWTGLEAGWTNSGTNCAAWVDDTSANMGRAGTSNATSSAAIAGGTASCDGLRRILCVEQY
ncbi:MAG TPA: DUF1554 domain-containing protein [Myxococcaceae bacterium]|nr:DUF1554 domain-containing protein [Myxococcaceae bacterium]